MVYNPRLVYASCMYIIIYIFFLSLSFSLSQASSITSFLLFIVALPPLGALPSRRRWQLNFQTDDTLVRHLQYQVVGDGGIIDNSAKFELRIGSSITIYDNNCRTFSILIMRSFCFVFFFFLRRAPSLCTSCAPE